MKELALWSKDAFLQNGFTLIGKGLMMEGTYEGQDLVVIMQDDGEKVRAVLRRKEYEELTRI